MLDRAETPYVPRSQYLKLSIEKASFDPPKRSNVFERTFFKSSRYGVLGVELVVDGTQALSRILYEWNRTNDQLTSLSTADGAYLTVIVPSHSLEVIVKRNTWANKEKSQTAKAVVAALDAAMSGGSASALKPVVDQSLQILEEVVQPEDCTAKGAAPVLVVGGSIPSAITLVDTSPGKPEQTLLMLTFSTDAVPGGYFKNVNSFSSDWQAAALPLAEFESWKTAFDEAGDDKSRVLSVVRKLDQYSRSKRLTLQDRARLVSCGVATWHGVDRQVNSGDLRLMARPEYLVGTDCQLVNDLGRCSDDACKLLSLFVENAEGGTDDNRVALQSGVFAAQVALNLKDEQRSIVASDLASRGTWIIRGVDYSVAKTTPSIHRYLFAPNQVRFMIDGKVYGDDGFAVVLTRQQAGWRVTRLEAQ
jgi:hypothetical protein